VAWPWRPQITPSEGFWRRVATAAPDGYTLLMAIDSTLIMNQFLYPTLSADLTTTPPPC